MGIIYQKLVAVEIQNFEPRICLKFQMSCIFVITEIGLEVVMT